MKKAVFSLVLCLSLATFGFSDGFSIKLNGGANFLMGGDYNKVIEGTNAYWRLGWTVNNDLAKLSMGWSFGAEFIFNITKEMGIGLGVGYITASDESTITAISGAAQFGGTFAPSVSAIPVTLNFHYFLPINNMMNIHFSVGPGLFISTFKFDVRENMGTAADPGLAWDWTQSFTPDGVLGFGFQGGLGLELALSPGISLCFDVLGRMANFSGFSGAWTLSGEHPGWPVSDSGTGTFYYFENDGYSSFTIDDTMPSGSEITNARKASISLSGVCAMAGIKIKI